MRRPKPQPKHTRLPRLHEARPPHREDAPAHEHKPRKRSPRRVTGESNYRLRNVHSD